MEQAGYTECEFKVLPSEAVSRAASARCGTRLGQNCQEGLVKNSDILLSSFLHNTFVRRKLPLGKQHSAHYPCAG